MPARRAVYLLGSVARRLDIDGPVAAIAAIAAKQPDRWTFSIGAPVRAKFFEQDRCGRSLSETTCVAQKVVWAQLDQ
jgi:hypothetical protein